MSNNQTLAEVMESSNLENKLNSPHGQVETNEADTLSDLNVFSFWREEIIALYSTGRSLPKDGIFRRALQRSNLVEIPSGRCIWSEYGLALIEEELENRGITVERHRSLHWRRRRP